MSDAQQQLTVDPMAAAMADDPMAAVMAGLQRTNPQLATIAQMMQARRVPETGGDEAAELARRLAEAEARIGTLKRQGRRLFEDYMRATERLDDLAAALGACAMCWGEDADCPNCRGRGRPGMVRPDLERRAALIGRREPVSVPKGGVE